jgi:hypothetical protein
MVSQPHRLCCPIYSRIPGTVHTYHLSNANPAQLGCSAMMQYASHQDSTARYSLLHPSHSSLQCLSLPGQAYQTKGSPVSNLCRLLGIFVGSPSPLGNPELLNTRLPSYSLPSAFIDLSPQSRALPPVLSQNKPFKVPHNGGHSIEDLLQILLPSAEIHHLSLRPDHASNHSPQQQLALTVSVPKPNRQYPAPKRTTVSSRRY